MSDTFERSCDHWSEAKRQGMEDFYALARTDYRHLAQNHDWADWLENHQRRVGERPLRLLDVACGSGKFPAALLEADHVTRAAIQPIAYSLLDPSGFSIDEARKVLAPPFVPDQDFEVTLQDLDCPAGAFDLAWATHALYAVPEADIPAAVERLLHALNGSAFIAHATQQSHYLHFYRLFLDAFRGSQGEPYTSAEQLVAALEKAGARLDVREITYTNGLPEHQTDRIEGFLQRCVFDDTVSLDAMLEHSLTGPYLTSCRQDGEWRFSQRVLMIFINP